MSVSTNGATSTILPSERPIFNGDTRASESRKLTFVDLFAGIGGTRLAFQQAQCSCVFSSEWDKFACKTYEANFGDSPHGDLTKIPSEDIPPHDILVAGFPCQPFSLSGISKKNSLGRPHGFDDRTQGNLFFEIERILRFHRPSAFLLENVKHLERHDKGRTFRVINDTLEGLGYRVYPKIIDSRTVVPQHRERIYIVGFRPAQGFEFPEILDFRPRVRDILEPDVENKYTLSDHLWGYLRDYAERHRARGNGFGYGLADLDGIARTLSARYHKDGSEILIPQGGELNPRRLTPRECARLMGFPDSFVIPVSDTQAYRQFGNSVVVPVVESIASAMVKALLSGAADDKCSRDSASGDDVCAGDAAILVP